MYDGITTEEALKNIKNIQSQMESDRNMDRKRIVKELDEYVKGINSYFSVSDDSDLNLYSNNNLICYFINFKENRFLLDPMDLQEHESGIIGQTSIIGKFHKKAVELMRQYEAKYTVQVIKHDEYSYVNLDAISKEVWFRSTYGGVHIKTRFTQSEIEELKKRDDIAIDWDKAIIKEIR